MLELSLDEVNAVSGAVDWLYLGVGLIAVGGGLATTGVATGPGALVAAAGVACLLYGNFA